MSFISVIIPYFKAAATLPATLDSLARQCPEGEWEVVIADNEASAELRSLIDRYTGVLPVRVVDASLRRGQAHAMNVGAHAARGDRLLFCDADDVVGDGWLSAMDAALGSHDAVAARWDIERLNPRRLWRSRGNPQADGLQRWARPRFLPHAGGGSLGVRRAVHEAVGDFDETLAIVHDTDYCWRLQLAGFAIKFVPGAVVHIRFREPGDGMFRQARAYGRASVALYARYRNKGMAPARLSEGLRAWGWLAARTPRIFRGGARARWLWKVGYRTGRIAGSIQHRVVFL